MTAQPAQKFYVYLADGRPWTPDITIEEAMDVYRRGKERQRVRSILNNFLLEVQERDPDAKQQTSFLKHAQNLTLKNDDTLKAVRAYFESLLRYRQCRNTRRMIRDVLASLPL